MENKNDTKTAPLSFRLYQSVRFNRPVDPDNDCISPGGYALTMENESAEKKQIEFDFYDYEGTIDKNDPHIVHLMQKNPDYETYSDLNTVTEHMLRHVTDVSDWFIFTGEPGEQESPLVPVSVTNVEFEIINGDSITRIPMDTPVTPSCGI